MKKWHITGISILAACLINGGCENSVNNPVGSDFSIEDASRATSAGKKTAVTVCHETGNGTYVKITVNENALPAHRNHGDLLPGSGGLDESCSASQVPPAIPAPPPVVENPCPCFGEGEPVSLDLTFGGSAFQVVSTDNGLITSAYGLFFGSPMEFRVAEAGQSWPEGPYYCKFRDDTVQLLTERTDITPAESEACRQMIRDTWPTLF